MLRSMPVSRRFFLQKTIGLLCCFGTFVYGALPLLSRRIYVFKVSMTADQDFSIPDTRFWEDQAGLVEINSRYFEAGKLLALKEVENKKTGTITWLYMFDEQKSFKQWDKEVLSTGLFKRDNIPSSVNYQVEEFSS
jgi:hypothetical protein